ncbi:MAG: N-acetylmuramoyl-L-alanine amidase [Sphingomonas bacterium]|nr:N-acetylmuramoyl-L-alanine amidase [Sphingomonas bacterium]MDB5688476.1 N-acetylmuramoyl-L-alanine amidase [Sphingomonas bacterium]
MLLASVTGAGNRKLPGNAGPRNVPAAGALAGRAAPVDYDWTGTAPARQDRYVFTALALLAAALPGLSPLSAAVVGGVDARAGPATMRVDGAGEANVFFGDSRARIGASGGMFAQTPTLPPLFRTAAAQQGSITIPLDPAPERGVLRRPRISGARGANRPLVVIDAGHGGHDSGALSIDGRFREKDAALAIARAMRDELVRSGRVRVAMTREDDRFLVLGDRREIARRLKADLFISVHADSAPNAAARGATVYTLSEVASDRVAAQLAAKENKADILNGVDLGGENDDVSSILIDLARRETMNVSSAFAALMQREMSATIPFKGEFHRFAGLIVLKAPDVPSVLLETGYISNEADRELIFSPEYQRNIAIGVRRAVEAHFARQLAAR